nr:hypothetical protein [Tanacetum cinerariifolium]
MWLNNHNQTHPFLVVGGVGVVVVMETAAAKGNGGGEVNGGDKGGMMRWWLVVWRQWRWSDCGGGGCGWEEWRRRMVASDIWDRIDRNGRSIFGFGRKTRRKTFLAAAIAVAGGRWPEVVVAGGEE